MINFDTAVLSAREPIEFLLGDVYVLLLNFLVMWMLIYGAATSALLHLCNMCSSKFVQLSENQRIKVIAWGIDTITGITSIILLFFWVPRSIIFQGTIYTGQRTGILDTNWAEPVGWVYAMQGSIRWVGWGVVPLLLGYVFSLCHVAKASKLRPMLVLHHLISIGTFMFIVAAIFSTLNGLWFQLGMIFTMHIACEFPISISLILYRLKSQYAHPTFLLMIPYEMVIRLFLWTASALNYWQLCFNMPALSQYENIWTFLFPMILFLQIALEGFTISIHFDLAIRSRHFDQSTLGTTCYKGPGGTAENDADVATEKQDSMTEDENSSGSSTVKDDLDNSIACEKIPMSGGDNNPGSRLSSVDAEAPASSNRLPINAGIVLNTLSFLLYCLIVAVFSNSTVLSVSERAEVQPRKRLRVAIVGGGIAGMGAALAFKNSTSRAPFEVDLFDADAELGGAAKTFHFGDTCSQEGHIDIAFAAFRDYHNFQMLLKALGVKYKSFVGTFTIQYETPVPFTDGNGANNSGEVLSATLPRSEKNKNRIFKYMEEVHDLSVQLDLAFEKWNEHQLMGTTLQELLDKDQDRFSEDFRRDYLSPCLHSYVATSAGMFDMPVAFMHSFEKRFRLCLSNSRVHTYSITNGVGEYVDKLKEHLLLEGPPNRVRLHLGNGIVAARMASRSLGGTVSLLDQNGVWRVYNHVIFSIKRHEIRRILDHPDSSFCVIRGKSASDACSRLYQGIFPAGQILGGYHRTIVHNDTESSARSVASLMSSDGCNNVEGYNQVLKDSTLGPNTDLITHMFSWNFDPSSCNKNFQPPYKISYDPKRVDQESLGVSSENILDAREWYHMKHDASFFQKGRASHVIQGLGSFWFAGSEFTMNFHEEAFVSGLVIAQRLGAGYLFGGEESALSELTFRRIRNWMLFGLNPLIPTTVSRGK